ncbi:unnamed protein product, partial [Allacma fusca]
MDKRQICCCGSSRWTRIIGWLQILIAISSILGLSLVFIGNVNNLSESSALHSLTFSFAVITLKLVFYIISFIMGVVLLLGSYNKNPRQIFAWMIYAAIFVFVFTINAMFECIEAHNWVEVAGVISSILLVLAIHRF